MTDECCKRNFFQSALDTASKLVKDPTPASSELKEARLAVCGECEHLTGGICGLCGCIVNLKAGFRSMECPDDRWPTTD